MNRSTILNFTVRNWNGDTLIETDFPRLAAQRVARRAQIVRLDAEYAARRAQAACIVASLEQRRPARCPMATPRPMATRPTRVNATRWAIMVAAALAVAAIVLAVAV